MRTLITICARGGSKGIPNKNIKSLADQPLIAYTIDIAKSFAALSTDSQKILQVAQQYGLQTDYLRPEYLAGDKAGKVDAVNDVLLFYEKQNQLQYDLILDLDVTAPLRTLKDLQEAYEMINADSQALNLFSVSPARKNPYFNMVEAGNSGYYQLVKDPDGKVKSRQKAPEVYELNASFYFYKRAFFSRGLDTAITDRSLIYLMDHLCFDIDDPIDFEFMDFLMANNHLDFLK